MDTIKEIVTDDLDRTFTYVFAVVRLTESQELDPLRNAANPTKKRTVYGLYVAGGYYGRFAVRASAINESRQIAQAIGTYNGVVIDGVLERF